MARVFLNLNEEQIWPSGRILKQCVTSKLRGNSVLFAWFRERMFVSLRAD